MIHAPIKFVSTLTKVQYSFCTFSNQDAVLLVLGLSSVLRVIKLGVENEGKLKL